MTRLGVSQDPLVVIGALYENSRIASGSTQVNKNNTEEFYDSVIKPDLGVDLSPYVEIDQKQMETNKEVSDIFNKNGGITLFAVQNSILLDSFGMSDEMKQEGIAHGKMMKEIETLLQKLFAKRTGNKQDILDRLNDLLFNQFPQKDSSPDGLHLGSPDLDDPSIKVYGNGKWHTISQWREIEKTGYEAEFLNTYQINKDSLDSNTLDRLMKLYEAEKQRQKDLFWTEGIHLEDLLYEGSATEYTKAVVLQSALSKQEWLNIAQSNYDVLKEQIEKDSFDSMPSLRKETLIKMFDYAKTVLADMKEIWKYGDVDKVA